MKKSSLLLLFLLVSVVGASAWGACPEDSLDRGTRDTMYIETWAPDVADTAWARSGLHFVKVPIYVTADIVAPYDSINAFVIPLCFTHTNPSKYCSVSQYWNEILWTPAKLPRNIFHHLPSNADIQVHNWMMNLFDAGDGAEWNGITLDLDGTSHFWLSTIPSGSEDQRFIAGSKILLATMTMKLEDTMNICIDTCFWPPYNSLAFGVTRQNGLGCSKIPRSGTDTSSFQVCFPHASEDVREIEDNNETHPSEFSLSQNYPNPFNPTTNFQFSLSKSSHVKIEIFNMIGQKVKVLVDEDMKPGVYSADWNGRDENGNSVSSGIYFYRMQSGEYTDTKKMVLMK